MLNNDTIVKVTNRSNSIVGYIVPELGVRRRFSVGETKDLTAKEIRALAYCNGGKAIITNHLIIQNEELVNEIIYNVQPEYYYTVEDVKALLLMGTEDQLLDALDFGGDGVISLIKDTAVALKLNDVRKREIIQKKTGFNVTNAIDANIASEVVVEEPKARRAAPITAQPDNGESTQPQRRTAAPKYSIKVTTE